ncbi:GCN5-related N-acetyltransferase [Flavobacteriales bacterium ALC-1]|nr:GCN5-related N-acetyltransferase [Flavobacteriales bacterium ALC-1]
MNLVNISKANYDDVSKIYADGIKTGCATFETVVPNWEDWDKAHLTFARIALMHNNNMLGWAALSATSKRKAYRGVAEVSVYVAKNKSGKGIGTKLLKSLIKVSEVNNIWTLQAGIMEANKISIKMHINCGFRQIGYREKIGNLNGKWLNNIILERRSKIIGT